MYLVHVDYNYVIAINIVRWHRADVIAISEACSVATLYTLLNFLSPGFCYHNYNYLHFFIQLIHLLYLSIIDSSLSSPDGFQVLKSEEKRVPSLLL